MNSPLPILLIVALAVLSGWRDIDNNKVTTVYSEPSFASRTDPCQMQDGNFDTSCVSRQEMRTLLSAVQ